MKPRDLALGALLAAFALVIPIWFGFARVTIPPVFTGTLASHVPQMLAMFGGPVVAVVVGLASAAGFFVVLGPVVGARAAIHAVFGLVGANLIRRGWSFRAAALAVLPIHALGEALVVLPFGFTLRDAGLVVGVGTAIHHVLDFVIAALLIGALARAGFDLRRWHRGEMRYRL